ncbi:hypothetical protein [Thomasclavelia saccharogumia]|uniref:hypothetical protein n=1 Tax=Thomasclavelia saccharogumia TaxID=341225 RepID=UPI001F0B0C54|nr:hypothetical protein [Thomasclavelia saccharogumia]
MELTDRIVCFLDMRKMLETSPKRKTAITVGSIAENTIIELNIVCSKKHRAFFIKKLIKAFLLTCCFKNG